MSDELLRLKNQTCFRLYTASRLLTQSYYPVLDAIGLTYPQYLVMMVLWENDGLKVMEISHKLDLDSNTVTPLLKRMDDEGLVKRRKGKEDGRETFVFLTKKGKDLKEKALEVPTCMIDKLTSDKMRIEDFGELNTRLDALIDQLHANKDKEREAKLANKIPSKRGRKPKVKKEETEQ